MKKKIHCPICKSNNLKMTTKKTDEKDKRNIESLDKCWEFWIEINPLMDKHNLNLTDEQVDELLSIFADIV